jgi:hypothetical protein
MAKLSFDSWIATRTYTCSGRQVSRSGRQPAEAPHPHVYIYANSGLFVGTVAGRPKAIGYSIFVNEFPEGVLKRAGGHRMEPSLATKGKYQRPVDPAHRQAESLDRALVVGLCQGCSFKATPLQEASPNRIICPPFRGGTK